MGRLFTNTSTVDFGNGVPGGASNVWTFCLWLKPPTSGGFGDYIMRRRASASARQEIFATATPNFTFIVARATANTIYTTVNLVPVLNDPWTAVAVRFDANAGAGSKFRGFFRKANGLTTQLTWSVTTEGSGTVGDASAANWGLGDITNGTNSWLGSMDWTFWAPVSTGDGALRRWCERPTKLPSAEIFAHLVPGPSSVVPDYSGKGRNGALGGGPSYVTGGPYTNIWGRWEQVFTLADAEIIRPDSDVTVGTWTKETGSGVNVYQSIDELSRSDADYMRSAFNPSSDLYEASLEDVSDPNSSSGHVVRYSYYKEGTEQIDLVVRLMQGAVEIASWTHNNIGTAVVQQNQTLSGAQADAITNYNDLRLRFTANKP